MRHPAFRQPRPALDAFVQPGKRLWLNPAVEAREPPAQLGRVPREGAQWQSRSIKGAQNGARAGPVGPAEETRLHDLAKVKVDPRRGGTAAVRGSDRRSRRTQMGPDSLDMLAGVEAVGLEIGAIA